MEKGGKQLIRVNWDNSKMDREENDARSFCHFETPYPIRDLAFLRRFECVEMPLNSKQAKL